MSKFLLWFPVWAHVACVLMMIAIGNWIAAWFALVATFLAIRLALND